MFKYKVVYIHRSDACSEKTVKKVNQKSREDIMVGNITESKAYRINNIAKMEVVINRDVIFIRASRLKVIFAIY